MGAGIASEGSEIVIQGRGLDGLREPGAVLDAGNSGSTIRMLSGILAGQSFTSRISGDASLSRRPMDRIMLPLRQMGARIEARDGRFPPLEIHGGTLRSMDYTLPVPSAQVKTCVLLAGLYASGTTTVREPVATRDHTEIALREFGAHVERTGEGVAVQGRPRLEGRDLTVPSDLSSAAFFIVAALLVPGSKLLIPGVGLNPTRSGLLDFLVSMGASVRVENLTARHGEMVGDILVEALPLRGGVIEKGYDRGTDRRDPRVGGAGRGQPGRLARARRPRAAGQGNRPHRHGGGESAAYGRHRGGVRGRLLRSPAARAFSPPAWTRSATTASPWPLPWPPSAPPANARSTGSEAASVSFPEFYATLRQLSE